MPDKKISVVNIFENKEKEKQSEEFEKILFDIIKERIGGVVCGK